MIGGGAAGMMAAVTAAEYEEEVILLEKNEKLGKKIYITGKGRCNVTNNGDWDDFFRHVVHNPKFLFSSYGGWNSQEMMEWLEEGGLSLKVERGNRVFPESDRASDVTRVFEKKLSSYGVQVSLHTQVDSLIIEEEICKGVQLTSGKKIYGDRVIVATGGLSYPSTGSSGDGYLWARDAGHQVKKLSPALVPFNAVFVDGEPVKELQGLSLKNISISIYRENKHLTDAFGEMIFTHFGVSGPVILTSSSLVTDDMARGRLRLTLDWKPALTPQQLDARLLREFDMGRNRQLKNVMRSLLPSTAIPVVIRYAGVSSEKKVCEITREERESLVHTLKEFPLILTGFREYREAIITQGGVHVKEISPATMESQKVKNLYFAGEVLDVDAMTGGYNLQIAWCTGRAAGKGEHKE